MVSEAHDANSVLTLPPENGGVISPLEIENGASSDEADEHEHLSLLALEYAVRTLDRAQWLDGSA